MGRVSFVNRTVRSMLRLTRGVVDTVARMIEDAIGGEQK
jgi:hypothetical protein